MSQSPKTDPRILRLEELLDTHGADLERWPDAERAWARGAAEESAEAAALITRAKRLDAWLDQAPAPTPSPALRRAVAEIPVRHPHASGSAGAWFFAKLWKAIVAGALASALGVAVGVATLDSQAGSDDEGVWSDDEGLIFSADLDREVVP